MNVSYQGMSCEGACAHAHVRCAVARVRVRAKSILESVRDVRRPLKMQTQLASLAMSNEIFWEDFPNTVKELLEIKSSFLFRFTSFFGMSLWKLKQLLRPPCDVYLEFPLSFFFLFNISIWKKRCSFFFQPKRSWRGGEEPRMRRIRAAA